MRDAGGVQNVIPAVHPPLPIVGLSSTASGRPQRTRGVVVAVALAGPGEIRRGEAARAGRPEQFVLERIGKFGQLVERGERQADVGQFRRIKAVGRQDLGQQGVGAESS